MLDKRNAALGPPQSLVDEEVDAGLLRHLLDGDVGAYACAPPDAPVATVEVVKKRLTLYEAPPEPSAPAVTAALEVPCVAGGRVVFDVPRRCV